MKREKLSFKMVKIKIKKKNNNLCELSQNSAVELVASETGKI